MSILCLWSPVWRIDEESSGDLTGIVLEEAPRAVLEGRGVMWVDVRGLPGERIARKLIERLAASGMEGVRGGIGSVPIVAEGAARFCVDPLTTVPAGEEPSFLAPLPLGLITREDRLLTLLEGSGVERCGDLASMTAESVEVRFGSEGVRAWRLARGDDPRILFEPIPPERPRASLDFVDYTVRDATRLVFTLNALLEQVCETLRQRARRARAISISFALADGGTAREVLRTARPTAERGLWMRRLRAALERIELPAPISGIAVEVDSTDPVFALQGDLFDRGFATASIVEEAAARLLDMYRGIFVRQLQDPHPLAERRIRWVDIAPEEVASSDTPGDAKGSAPPALELQLLPEPRSIRVRGRRRRDHVLPVEYLEGKEWRSLTCAGPDRISGGHEEERPYAREYYRCVSDTGTLLWIYRDAVEGRWYLHGWWD